MENNRPHSREKRVGQGSVSARKGEQVNFGGPVTGGQGGRPGQGTNGPQRSRGPQRAGGGLGIGGIIVVLLLLFLRGGGSGEVQSTPAATPRPTAYVTAAPSHTQDTSRWDSSPLEQRSNQRSCTASLRRVPQSRVSSR